MRGDEKKHFKRSFNSYVEIIPAFLSSTEEMWINEVCHKPGVCHKLPKIHFELQKDRRQKTKEP